MSGNLWKKSFSRRENFQFPEWKNGKWKNYSGNSLCFSWYFLPFSISDLHELKTL